MTKHFLDKGDTEFRFPYKMANVELLDAEAEAAKADSFDHRLDFTTTSMAAELQKAFTSSTYVIVHFYTYHCLTPGVEKRLFAELARTKIAYLRRCWRFLRPMRMICASCRRSMGLWMIGRGL